MTDPIDTALTVDEARFRQVLGHFPTGVTVVASIGADGQPVGLAVGSFCSVSLEPALVLFCPSVTSTSFPAIRDAGVFVVNVLNEEQEDVSRVFASKAENKFAGVGWRHARSGSPIVNEALAWIDCRIHRIDEAGDHYVVIGQVLDLGVNDRVGGPLLFYRGGYGRFNL
jgi:flavin reductase (DIM6/NTAB) family NADH-FMN oxidoreductase RutF